MKTSTRVSAQFGSLPVRLNEAGGLPPRRGRLDLGKLHGGELGELGDVETLGVSPWLYYGASYAGSWLGGAGVGYVVAHTGKGAVTGGLASSSLWCFAEGMRGFRGAPPYVTAGLFGISALSLWVAWNRK